MSSRHERHIKVPGTTNFRDIGGYRTSDGKHVTMFKHYYRSDELSNVTTEGAKMLKEKLRVKYIIDLRSDTEGRRAPYSFSSIERVPLPMSPPSFTEVINNKEKLDAPEAAVLLSRVAATFLTDFRAELKRFFDIILTNVKGQAVVVHCTAGKDRTGIATALLLYALGVPEATIREDYLLTNQYIRPCTTPLMLGKCTVSVEAANVLLRAQETFFDSAMATAKKQYGSVEKYLQQEMGLTPAKLDQLKAFYTRKSSGA